MKQRVPINCPSPLHFWRARYEGAICAAQQTQLLMAQTVSIAVPFFGGRAAYWILLVDVISPQTRVNNKFLMAVLVLKQF